MKKSDWALIVLIVAGASLVSWFTIGAIFPPPSEENVETVKTAPSIVSYIEKPKNDIMLYSDEMPSWCIDNTTDTEKEENPEESGSSDNEGNTSTETSADKQYSINAVFNSCAINSSFTIPTDGNANVEK